MNWIKLPKWSDDADNRDITQLEAARQQHATNSHLPENEEDALLLLHSEDGAMNREDEIVEQRKN